MVHAIASCQKSLPPPPLCLLSFFFPPLYLLRSSVWSRLSPAHLVGPRAAKFKAETHDPVCQCTAARNSAHAHMYSNLAKAKEGSDRQYVGLMLMLMLVLVLVVD